MFKQCYFIIPLIGQIYFEWRTESNGKPFFVFKRYRREWVVCTGQLCGYYAPFEG
jgi:hypothetical protein